MGAVLTAAALAATALTAAGQISSGMQAKDAADYNAAVAEQEAQFQKQRTQHDLAFQRREVDRIVGKARVAGGGSGTGVSESLLTNLLTEAEIDEQLIRTQGSINVWRSESQKDLFKAQGEDAQTGGFIAGGATILGGLSQFDFRKTPAAKTKSKFYKPEHEIRSLVR